MASLKQRQLVQIDLLDEVVDVLVEEAAVVIHPNDKVLEIVRRGTLQCLALQRLHHRTAQLTGGKGNHSRLELRDQNA